MENDQRSQKLDVLIELVQNLLALELSRSGVPHGEIGKRLHVSKARIGQMLKGTKKDS